MQKYYVNGLDYQVWNFEFIECCSHGLSCLFLVPKLSVILLSVYLSLPGICWRESTFTRVLTKKNARPPNLSYKKNIFVFKRSLCLILISPPSCILHPSCLQNISIHIHHAEYMASVKVGRVRKPIFRQSCGSGQIKVFPRVRIQVGSLSGSNPPWSATMP